MLPYTIELKMAQLLINHPNCDINATTPGFGSPPLHVAASKNHTAIVQLLLQQPNCDINAFSSYGYNALTHAASYNSVEVAKLLINHPNIDVNAISFGFGNPPLQVAAKKKPYSNCTVVASTSTVPC